MQQIPPANDFPDVEACAAQLLEVVPMVMRAIRALMRAHSAAEMSVPHFRALGYIQRHPDCSLSAVAEHVGLSVPAASRLVDALVADGLVERQLSATDRRYVALHLTERGTRIREETRAQTLQSLTALLAPLDATERDVIMGAMPPLRAIFTVPVATAESASAIPAISERIP